jgi:hypothetical protein
LLTRFLSITTAPRRRRVNLTYYPMLRLVGHFRKSEGRRQRAGEGEKAGGRGQEAEGIDPLKGTAHPLMLSI